MPDIYHDLLIKAPIAEVFRAVSTPKGLDSWWTLSSSGSAMPGFEFELGFGPDFQWKSVVTRSKPPNEFELEITVAMDDWIGTKVGFRITEESGGSRLEFRHTGWAETSPHFRYSSFCWASYLRILRRWLELGISVPYDLRNEN